jgi:hypothetical protein
MKSPLKSKPLRNPGDSVQDSLTNLFFDDVLAPYLGAALLIVLAVVEWIRWYFSAPPNPWLFTALATGYSVFCALKIRRAYKKSKPLRLGRDGERAVGQYLERLRKIGAQVFHDIPGENFNIDHVVIHSSGLYVIETKTYSKPDKGAPKIVFDGESVSFGGWRPERDSVAQAKACATWLSQLLTESCGKTPNVRPVVVYPGWYVVQTAEARQSDVWVLNPKALPGFIGHSKQVLSTEDVNLYSFHLGRYIRGV